MSQNLLTTFQSTPAAVKKKLLSLNIVLAHKDECVTAKHDFDIELRQHKWHRYTF